MTGLLKKGHGDGVVALEEALLNLGASVDRHLARLARKSGVSMTAAQLLIHLDDGDPLRCTDLVQLSGHNVRTIAAALESLEQAGLVRRYPDERDARAKRVAVTNRGRDVARVVASRRRSFLVEFLDVLNLHEREGLIIMLTKLHHRLACYEAFRFSHGPAYPEDCQVEEIPAHHIGWATRSL